MGQVDEIKLRVERSVKRGKQLGVLVGVAQRIREITADSNAPIKELVHVIESDSVLTLRVLRVVNSAAFGCQQHINSIDQAVVLLGFKQLRELCVGLQVIRGLGQEGDNEQFNRAELWKHSLGTAVAAKLLEEHLTGVSDPGLFVTGLLCNVGRVILDQFFTEEFGEALRVADEEGIRLTDAEQQVVHATHAQVGYWAVLAWGLDETMATTIRDHHGPGGNHKVDIVNVAYVLTQALGFGAPGERLITPLLPSVFKRLQVDETELRIIMSRLTVAFEDLEPVIRQMLS